MNCHIRNVHSGIKAISSKYIIWILSGFILALLIAQFITSAKFIYLAAIFLTPVIIYISIRKPFIFPLGFYVCFIPFDEVLILTGGSRGPTLTKLLAALTILVLLLKGAFENKFRKPDRLATWWLFFILYCALSSMWAIEPSLALSRLPTAMGLLVLYFLVAIYKVQKKEFESLKWFILAGGVLASLVTIYNYHAIAVIDRTSLVLGDRQASLNTFAFGLLLPISLCIEKILSQENSLLKIIFGILLSILTFCIVITGSRGAMLGIVVIFAVYYFSLRNKIMLNILLIIIGIILLSFIPAYFFERWELALSGGGSGRTIIWGIGLKALQKYITIGAGLSNFPAAYNEFMDSSSFFKGFSRAPHNIYLGFLVELGVIGFSLMVLALWKHYKAISDNLSQNINHVMLKAALAGILISSFFLDTVWLKSFWLIFMMITLYKYVHTQEANDNDLLRTLTRSLLRNN